MVGLRNFYSSQEKFADAIYYFRRQADLERASCYTPPISAYFTDSFYNSKTQTGDERLREIEATVLSFFQRTPRFEFQRILHEQVIRGTLFHILGDQYYSCVERVCNERGWEGDTNNLFTVASRRAGKTTGMTSMVAAMLIHIPGLQVVVYSVAKRMAVEFVHLVEDYIRMHARGRNMIANAGGSESLVLNQPGGKKSRIRSFPSGGRAKDVSDGCARRFPCGRVCRNYSENSKFTSLSRSRSATHFRTTSNEQHRHSRVGKVSLGHQRMVTG